MARKTIVVLIGNSDGKLSQKEWCQFFCEMSEKVQCHGKETHFVGFSVPASPWQNAAVCIELKEGHEMELAKELSALSRKYNQDGIAVVCGETKFVG